ncbi:MAG: hypothetical protein RLZZ130_1954 [Pseudomonadota bacterium]|jgi:hypothetical protein
MTGPTEKQKHGSLNDAAKAKAVIPALITEVIHT